MRKRKKPFRVAIIGIDGSGKTTIALKLKEEYGEQAGLLQVRGYPQAGKLGRSAAKVFDRAYTSKTKKTTPKTLAQAGYLFSFPFVRIPAEKNKSIMIYDRYPLYEVETHSKARPSKKMKIVKKISEKASGAPEADVVVVTLRDPEIAFEELKKRKKIEYLEDLESLKKMRKAVEEEIVELRKRGVKVITIPVDELIKKYGTKKAVEIAVSMIKKEVDMLRGKA